MKTLKVIGLVAVCLFGLAFCSTCGLAVLGASAETSRLMEVPGARAEMAKAKAERRAEKEARRAEARKEREARRAEERKVKEARRARELAWSGAVQQAQGFFKIYLRDHDSAKFDWGYGKDPELHRWAETSWLQPDGSVLEGWQLTVPVNAKNGFGAYVGWQTYFLLFKGGLVASASGAGRLVEVRDGFGYGQRIYP